MYTIELPNTIELIKEQATYDENGVELTPLIMKTQEEIDQEKQVIINAKSSEIQAKIDQYEQAKTYQLLNGGAGPVADFEIMKICNEHNSQFEVVIEE